MAASLAVMKEGSLAAQRVDQMAVWMGEQKVAMRVVWRVD
jgi:hypothetical protein